tara:strand:+ start:2476 stop:3654 length:1179 start_codon:yes stop_codon:yes gene_type:complete
LVNRVKSSWPKYSSEEIDEVIRVLETNKVNYWSGCHGREFEKEFSSYFNVDFSIAVSNGTLALDLALRSVGIELGDEVVVTPRTFIASVAAIINLGAKPVFADVDLDSGNITAENIAKVLTSKTKAIICVHLAGWPCDMDPIIELAKSKNIFLVEDCAQAHHAKYKDKFVGTIGDIAAWSFCEDKIMTTGGEGGMVTTNNEELFKKAWSYKDHGKDFEAFSQKNSSYVFKYIHNQFGSNYRMTEIQSVIGRRQLRNLEIWQKTREENAMRLMNVCKMFQEIIRAPLPSNDYLHAYYKYYIYIEPDALKPDWSRDKIVKTLNTSGLPCGSGSCPEVYLEKAFNNIDFENESRLSNAKSLGEKSIMFLVHPTLTEEEMDFASETISNVMGLAKR